jgi:rhodanese-related sulfurtransferase
MSFLLALLFATKIANPQIDMPRFLVLAGEAAEHRETRRVSEEEFLRMSGEAGTVVLDARSREKFEELHVKGAVNLSFPDFTEKALAEVIPARETRVLIYCNNNFMNDESAFALKAPPASLNLSTYVALYTYGYRNVYELGPRLDVRTTKLVLEGKP